MSLADHGQLAILAEIARLATLDLELRAMLQRITDVLAARFGWELVALVRIDEERRAFVCEAITASVPTVVAPGYGRSFGSGVVGEVAAGGRAILLDDVAGSDNFVEVAAGTRAELCVPIRHAGRVVAVLNLESPRAAAFRHQLPLVEAIADQMAGVIASARLYEAVRQRALQFEVLSEVSRVAVAGADPASVLHHVAAYLQRRFDLAMVAIVVADDGAREWQHRAIVTRTPVPVTPRDRWPIQAGVVGRAIREGVSQWVPDVRVDPDYFGLLPELRAELAVPIRLGDRSVGALNLENDDPGALSADNVRLFELVADQVAGAIRLALLNEELSATTLELERANRSLQRANRALARRSLVDPLTGVANRRHLEEVLDAEWRRAIRARRPLSLLLVDVDHFKAYNDSAGHLAGDRCLREVARVLGEVMRRSGELVARYGGEEFAVVLPDSDGAGAVLVAAALRARLAAREIAHPASALGPWVTVSIGVATHIPRHGEEPSLLIARADRALYRAKELGRDRVVEAAADRGEEGPAGRP